MGLGYGAILMKSDTDRTPAELFRAIADEEDYVSCSTAARLAGWVDNGIPDTKRVYEIVFRSSHKPRFAFKKLQGRTKLKLKPEFGKNAKISKTVPESSGKKQTFLKELRPGLLFGKSARDTEKFGKNAREPVKTPGPQFGKNANISEPSGADQPPAPERGYSKGKENMKESGRGYDSIHNTVLLMDYRGEIHKGERRGNWYSITDSTLITKLAKLAIVDPEEIRVAYTAQQGKAQGTIQLGISRKFSTEREKVYAETIVARNLERELRIIVSNIRYRQRRQIRGHLAKKDSWIDLLNREGIEHSRGTWWGHTWNDRSDPGHLEADTEEDAEDHYDARERLSHGERDDVELHNIGPRARDMSRSLVALTHLEIRHNDQLESLTKGTLTTNQYLQAMASNDTRRVKLEERLVELAEKALGRGGLLAWVKRKLF